jgi:hypothetical protein
MYGYSDTPSTVEPVKEKEGEREGEEVVTTVPTSRRSESSTRARRRNRVVPLEAQKEVTPDTIEAAITETKEEPGRGVAVAGFSIPLQPEGMSSRGGVVATVLKTTPPTTSASESAPPTSSTTPTSSVLSVGMLSALLEKASPPRKGGRLVGVASGAKPSSSSSLLLSMEKASPPRKGGRLVGVASGAKPSSSSLLLSKTPAEQGAGRTDIEGEEEVDVEEMGEVDFGIVRGDEETMLRLDDFMKLDDVVRMGDIEAGLSRNGGEMLEGIEGEGLEMGGTGGVLSEEVLESQRVYEGVEEEEEEGRRGAAERSKRKRSAVYEDVLLSSGSTQFLGELRREKNPSTCTGWGGGRRGVGVSSMDQLCTGCL